MPVSDFDINHRILVINVLKGIGPVALASYKMGNWN